jgi:NADPH2:quinone reductase
MLPLTMTKTMKAFLLDRPGEPETLRLAEIAVPEPDADQVRVRVEAVSLNPVDYKIAARRPASDFYPFILGVDVAGTIDAVGRDVKDWKTGERVYYHGDLRNNGGFAQFTLADPDALARVPASVTAVQAAAIPTAGFTAYQVIHCRAPLKKGQTVLIHGGSGGVGGFAIQLAKRLGLNIITTASMQHEAYVRKLGADHVIDYRGDVAGAVMKITNNRGVDLALDSVGSESATKTFKLLAFSGHLVCTPQLPDFSIWKPFEKAVAVHEIALGAAYGSGDRIAVQALGEIAAKMIAMVERKEIDPLVGEIIGFSDIPSALARLKRREVPSGKVVADMLR